ncbi:MAG: 16S rRNA (uracil(1498)-N(3))-methyltransferase [Bacteroidales bacterium]|nr:16S rRNA (uracil(1498)-N(3))-methyltransferase [Bacteroidales bacterium]
MNLFYSDNISQGYCVFPEIESRHLIKVMRKTTGDQVFFVDGKGGYYEGVIHDPHPKRCLIQITNKKTDYGKKNYSLHMAVAPTKNIDRFEWFLEKATEIGVDRISPVLSFHSERKQIKPDRLNRVLTAAMKQSLKAYHPVLEELTSFKEFISRDFTGQKYIPHCNSTDLVSISSVLKPGTDALIMIGPEGDFSLEEVEMAEKNGFIGISLGKSRLRTETAAIIATHSVYFVNHEA